MDWFPVFLSLRVAFFSMLLVLITGVPLAWLLARSSIPGRDLLSSLVTLPMVLPPTVLGYYLLLLLGRQSPLGSFLQEHYGFSLVFTWQAAVLAAAVASLPLMTRTVQASLEAVDSELEDVARTLGRSETAIFFTVTVPLTWKGIVAGLVLSFARSMGEFGATLMVAGNIPGKTQTLSIAIYDAVQHGETGFANLLVLLISGITVVALLLLSRLTKRGDRLDA